MIRLPGTRRTLLAVALAMAALAPALPRAIAQAEETVPREMQGIKVEEHLGAALPLDAQFKDHTGKPVRLGDYFRDGKPAIVTMNYYRCPMLCTLQLNGLAEGLKQLGWKVGEQFRIVTVGINPREGATLAREKRNIYVKEIGQIDADWTFLTGSKAEIDRVASTLGFGYVYDEERDEYGHPAAIALASPTATVSRYLYGLDYQGRDLKFGLMDASEGKVGTTLDRVVLSCFHYDASRGSYAPFAMGVMRLGGALTASVLAAVLLVLWRIERFRQHREVPT